MKRVLWTLRGSKLQLARIGVPECYALVPETKDDEDELRVALRNEGVSHRMSFANKNGIDGRIDLPQQLTWSADGTLEVVIVGQSPAKPLAAWFWIVEDDDGTGRRFAWWATIHDSDEAQPWT